MHTNKNRLKPYLLSLAPALVIAVVIMLLNPGQQPLIGFMAAFLLGWISSFFLIQACNRQGCSPAMRWATALCFGLRLLIGVILFITLPIYGHGEAPPRAGYLYLDAYQRDTDAWRLADSGDSLGLAFQNEFYTDQYGGLLSLSGAVYRFLSPDAHRPLLILIITSFFTAIGLPFLWKAVAQRWGERVATASAWLYTLYPESIILGASQMREPILIGLSALAFWGVLAWKENRHQALAALISSALGMVFISLKAGAAILGALAIWFWMENILPAIRPSWRLVSSLLLLATVLVGVFLNWGWLVGSAKWDLYLMEASSGRIQFELDIIGPQYRTPFIIGYGLAQPVLPAAIIYPGIAITRSVAIFRSIGWYILVPLLAAGFILMWGKESKADRRVLIYFFLLVFVWVLLSSVRAGGDQWDNPRYRAIFLVWMVLLAGWSWVETHRRRSPWLLRLATLELIYIGYFLHWYISRYYGWFNRLKFWRMISTLGVYGALMLFGGLAVDWVYNKINKHEN